jgi:hypothetical protein
MPLATDMRLATVTYRAAILAARISRSKGEKAST